jgi:hypothetical protein
LLPLIILGVPRPYIEWAFTNGPEDTFNVLNGILSPSGANISNGFLYLDNGGSFFTPVPSTPFPDSRSFEMFLQLNDNLYTVTDFGCYLKFF